MAVLGLLAAGQPGLPGDRGVDPLGDEGRAGVARRHVLGLDVGELEPGLLEQHAEIELRDRALGVGDALAFEVGDARDVLVGDDAVAALGIVEREQVAIAPGSR